MNSWKQVRAILLLPGIIAVIIPATILYCTGVAWPPSPWNIVLRVIGLLFIVVELILSARTIGVFITVGHGNLDLGRKPMAPIAIPVASFLLMKCPCHQR